MNRRFVSDSSCDIFSMPGCDFISVPLHILTSEKDYADTPSLNVAQMVQELNAYKGRTSTSCSNSSDCEAAFGSADEVFAITITGALSGSCNAAQCAAAQYMQHHPGRRVHVIDSLSTGPELVLILEKLRELTEKGFDFEETKTRITAYQQQTHLVFVLSSVQNLAKNGRASKLEAKAVGLLGIRIVGQASPEGRLGVIDKCRGEDAGMLKAVLHMKKLGWAKGRVIITHCMNESGAKKLRASLRELQPDIDIRILTTGGLCSFYAEEGGLLVGYEAF